MRDLTRRTFSAGAAGGAALIATGARAEAAWSAGDVAHILPAASAHEILLKVSFVQPLRDDVALLVGGRRLKGERTDSEGRFWRFRASGLESGVTHTLQLRQGRRALCDPWPLKTFPAPDAEISSFRIATYTCAGGLEGAKSIRGIEAFRTLAMRQKLMDRALSFAPDAVIANGDHIYWDQRAWLEHPLAEIRALTREAYDKFGYLDRSHLMFGTPNEAIIKRLADPQIAQLYGVRMRSTPCFFVGDDHDYFENDDANEKYVTFPPDDFQVRAARAVQRLYYPEFLPDPHRPNGLSGASAPDNGVGVSECFGTLRAGKLIEANLYDCGRFLSLKGAQAGLVPDDAEAWLIQRTRAEDTRHYLHIPSHPMGWTAGKWREWYPDVVASGGVGDAVVSTHGEGERGRLTTARGKFMWQAGWNAQHQRIAAALSAQKNRAAAMVSGDLHAIGHATMTRSGDLNFNTNPVHTVIAGPISTSGAGWPTFARGTRPEPSALISLSQSYAPQEKNGFTLIDVERDRMVIRLFAWREPDPIDSIDTLQPFDVVTIPVRT